jgi:hypothetical protein
MENPVSAAATPDAGVRAAVLPLGLMMQTGVAAASGTAVFGAALFGPFGAIVGGLSGFALGAAVRAVDEKRARPRDPAKPGPVPSDGPREKEPGGAAPEAE